MTLPSPTTTRWVASRKSAVVKAINAGSLTRESAMRIYGLSEEEIQSWIDLRSEHGIRGLRATYLSKYRGHPCQ